MNPMTPEQKLLVEIFAATPIVGDRQQVSDEHLKDVLTGKRRLTRLEYNSMVSSPLTLSRLRFLEMQRVNDLQRSVALTHGRSVGLVPEKGDDDEVTLITNDRYWILNLKKVEGKWHIKLQLIVEREKLELPEDEEVFVLDSKDGTLAVGVLDGQGCLQTVWDRSVDPITHLHQMGGTWTLARM